MSEHVEMTNRAAENIAKMANRILKANAEYGLDTEEVQKMVLSFVISIRAVMNLGGKIMADGNESLYGINEYIQFGLVAHPIGGEVPQAYLDSVMDSFGFGYAEALEFAKKQDLTACVSYSVNS